MKFRTLFLCVVAIFTSNVVSAAPAKVIDKRNQSEDVSYEVHFCYRPSPGFFGMPGHAYVAFSEQKNGSGQISFRAFGATASGITDIFGGDGYLDPEYASHFQQDCLVVKVNSGDYWGAWAIAAPLFGKPEYSYWNYHITDNSCVDFARRIAARLELKTNAEDVPGGFIKALKSRNN